MVAFVVVIRHKAGDLSLQFPGEVEVLQLHHVLHGAVIALDSFYPDSVSNIQTRTTIKLLVLNKKVLILLLNDVFIYNIAILLTQRL